MSMTMLFSGVRRALRPVLAGAALVMECSFVLTNDVARPTSSTVAGAWERPCWWGRHTRKVCFPNGAAPPSLLRRCCRGTEHHTRRVQTPRLAAAAEQADPRSGG